MKKFKIFYINSEEYKGFIRNKKELEDNIITDYNKIFQVCESDKANGFPAFCVHNNGYISLERFLKIK